MVRYNVHDPQPSEAVPALPLCTAHPDKLTHLLQEDCARLQELAEVCEAIAGILKEPDSPLPFQNLAAVRAEAERPQVAVAVLGSDAHLRNHLLLRTPEGGSVQLGVCNQNYPLLKLQWADFRNRPACLNSYAAVVLTASARAFVERRERGLEQQMALLNAPKVRRPALLLVLKNDADEACLQNARKLAKRLRLPEHLLFFLPGQSPAEALLNAVAAFQKERLVRLFAAVSQWSRQFMTRMRKRLAKAQGKEERAGRTIDRLCARTQQFDAAFSARRDGWLAGQWRRLDELVKRLEKHFRERAVFHRLTKFENCPMPEGANCSDAELARRVAQFWSERLSEELEAWDREDGDSRIQEHLESSCRACNEEVFDLKADPEQPSDLAAAVQSEVFAPLPARPAPDLLLVGCSLEAAFRPWSNPLDTPRSVHQVLGAAQRYRLDKAGSLTNYLFYWWQTYLDLQLLRDFLLSQRPHLSPQCLAARLNNMQPRAVELLSHEVEGELTNFWCLKDMAKAQQDAFCAACHVISLVQLFEVRHMRHDSFRRDDFPPLPARDPTGPYSYHHGLRLPSLTGGMGSCKLRAEVVNHTNVLDLFTELKAWQQLSLEGFPAIAHLHGTITLNNRFAFVFEPCDGRLKDLLQDDRTLVPHLQTGAGRLRALQQLCRFARQLFSATFFLHRRRFVHRDLATATILYNHGDWAYELKLANFTMSGTNAAIFDTITNLSWYNTAMHGQKLSLSPALDMCNLGLVLWEIYHGEPCEARPMRSEQSLIPNFDAFDGPELLKDLIRRLTSRDEACRPSEADEGDILAVLRGREVLGCCRRASKDS